MTSYYGTPDLTRDLLGVSEADAPDEILEEFLLYGTKMTCKYLEVAVAEEDLEQSGVLQNHFLVKNKYIADTNYDKTINASDVSVFYLDENNNKITLDVLSIDGSTGQVILKDIPTADQSPKINYSYYMTTLDWDLIDLACSYYAAFMWAGKELYLVPPKFFLGNLRLQWNEPWMNYKRMFDEICRQAALCKPITLVDYTHMVLYPREERLNISDEEWWYKLTGLLQ